MNRLKKTLGIASAFVLVAAGLAVPASAAPILDSKPKLAADEIVNPDGKVVKKLPALKAEKPKTASGQVIKKVPANPDQISTLATCDGQGTQACYLYNVGSQGLDTGVPGIRANMVVGGHQGALSGQWDYHTLGEMAVQSADGKQIIEVGWTVDPTVNKNPVGSSTGYYGPRLFVFSWVNDQPGVYNGGTFVPVSGATIVPGVTNLTAGANIVTSIWHSDAQNVWWIYAGEWIGYYPDSQWDNASPSVNFDRVGYYQLFGEIASTESKPRSDFGLGVVPTTANGGTGTARFSSTIFLTDPANSATGTTTGVDLYIRTSPTATTSPPYSGVMSTSAAGSPARGLYFGGPMWNAAKTGVGLKGQPTG